MGGGLMQLVAMGAQDVFLTGNPQITFFKVVYRRHTNFSKECIKQDFNGSVPSTGGSSGDVTCTLARNGDLVQEIYVKAKVNAVDDLTTFSTDTILISGTNVVTLSSNLAPANNKLVRFTADISIDDSSDSSTTPVITAGTVYTVANSNDSTFTLIKNGTAVVWGDLAAGTRTMGAHTSKLVLESTALNKDITNLVNTVELEIGGQKIDKHYAAWFDIYNELFEKNHDYRRVITNSTPGNGSIVYIPLRFWFNRNAGLALPLIALQYHEVKVLINLKVPDNSTLVNANLLVNYVYLDTDERRRFAQVSHEYLIEQVQHTGVESIKAGTAGVTPGRVDMNFNHPVKALFWTTDGTNYLDKVKIQLNGHDRFSEQDADYFHLVQPYECGLGNGHSVNRTTGVWGSLTTCSVTNSVGMYSFCLKPGEHQPSGSCNFSRIDNARLNYINATATADSLHLFALNYNVLRIMSGMGGLTYSN